MSWYVTIKLIKAHGMTSALWMRSMRWFDKNWPGLITRKHLTLPSSDLTKPDKLNLDLNDYNFDLVNWTS